MQLHRAAVCSMREKARAAARCEHAHLQDRATLTEAERYVRPIVRLRTLALGGYAGLHEVGMSKQLEDLIDQMRREIPEHAASRPRLFAPAFANFRAETFEAR